MISPRLLLVPAAVICVSVVAACGSASTSSDQTGGGPTKTVTVTLPQTTSTPVTSATGTSTTTLTGTTTTGTTTTGTTTTPTVSSDACVAADLTPSFLGTNGAAGTIALGFALTNSGSSVCTTYGWPGVEFLSSTGAGISTDAVRTTSDMLGDTPAADISLKPGQKVSFRLIASDFASGTSTCPNATELQIIAPNDMPTMTVPISGGIPACGHATLSPLMVGTSAWPNQ